MYILPQFQKVTFPVKPGPPLPHLELCLCVYLQSFHIQCVLLTRFTFVSLLSLEEKLLEDRLCPQHLGHSYQVNTC